MIDTLPSGGHRGPAVPNPLEDSGVQRARQQGFVGAPFKFNMQGFLERVKNAATDKVASKSPLSEENEALLKRNLAVYEREAETLVNNLADLKVTTNPLHQHMRVDQIFNEVITEIENHINSTNATILNDFDGDDESRSLLENRLEAERKRINDLETLKLEILRAIQERAQYSMRRQANKNDHILRNRPDLDINADDERALNPPGDGVYVVGEAKFSFMDAFFKNDFGGTKHTVTNEGRTHHFNPKNAKSIELIIAAARAFDGCYAVNFKLGFGPSDSYQMYNQMSPSTLRQLRNPARRLKFELELGIDYGKVKKFFEKPLVGKSPFQKFLGDDFADAVSSPNAIGGLRAKFEELLENLKDKTLNGTDAEVTAAEQKFKSFLKEFRESFPGLNDDVLAAPSITANIENFKLEPTEQALYARSKELKELYRFMRANEIEQRLNAGKSIDESSFESLQEQLNYISCGISRSEMGEQQTPPTLSPQG